MPRRQPILIASILCFAFRGPFGYTPCQLACRMFHLAPIMRLRSSQHEKPSDKAFRAPDQARRVLVVQDDDAFNFIYVARESEL